MPYQWCSYNNKVLLAPSGKAVFKMVTPPRTIILKFDDVNYDPSTSSISNCTWTHIEGGLWEFTSTATSWNRLFNRKFVVDGVTKTFSVESMNLDGLTYNNASPVQYMFQNSGVTSIKNIYVPSYITHIDYMFSYASTLVSVSSFDTSSIERMDGLFVNCTSLTNPPEHLDLSSCYGLGSMFNGCTSLDHYPAFTKSLAVPTSGSMAGYGVDTYRMFYRCIGLPSVIPNDFDFGNIVDTHEMFSGCTQITATNAMNLKDCGIGYKMFYGCTSLDTVTITNLHTNFRSSYFQFNDVFNGCTNLRIINAPTSDIKSNTTGTQGTYNNVDNMLYGCTKVEYGALAMYNKLSTAVNYSGVVSPPRHSATFYNCGSGTTSGAAELAQIPSDWK